VSRGRLATTADHADHAATVVRMVRGPFQSTPTLFEHCPYCGSVLLWIWGKLACPRVDCPEKGARQ
jgi:hypothetical protein